MKINRHRAGMPGQVKTCFRSISYIVFEVFKPSGACCYGFGAWV